MSKGRHARQPSDTALARKVTELKAEIVRLNNLVPLGSGRIGGFDRATVATLERLNTVLTDLHDRADDAYPSGGIDKTRAANRPDDMLHYSRKSVWCVNYFDHLIGRLGDEVAHAETFLISPRPVGSVQAHRQRKCRTCGGEVQRSWSVCPVCETPLAVQAASTS